MAIAIIKGEDKNENKIDLDDITCSMLYEIAGNICKVENWEDWK